MLTVKDLFENETLMNNIIEDIEDLPEDAEVFYAVWALGYDQSDEVTDTEYLIGEFDNPDEAVACAEKLTLETFEAEYGKPISDTAYLSIEVETLVGDPEDEDGGTMNIGTIYSRKLLLTDEPALEEPFVAILTTDFTILDDGILKVRCDLLKGYNKNDYVNFYFIDEHPDATILTYKIMSKVEYTDGDYFHCELMI